MNWFVRFLVDVRHFRIFLRYDINKLYREMEVSGNETGDYISR